MSLYTWGWSDSGRLGLGRGIDDVSKPRFVESLHGKIVLKAAGALSATVVITDEGEAYLAGSLMDVDAGDPVESFERVEGLKHKATQVACGGNHCVLVCDSGRVVSWGANRHGQLGHGDTTPLTTPHTIHALHKNPIKRVSCGQNHSAAVSEAGELFTWGMSTHGQLGIHSSSAQLYPKVVHAFNNISIDYVVCGGNHTVVMDVEGRVYAFGDNAFGQTGHGRGVKSVTTPQRIAALDEMKIVEIGASLKHTIFITTAGEMLCVGSNLEYQCGVRHQSHSQAGKTDVIFKSSGGTNAGAGNGANNSDICWTPVPLAIPGKHVVHIVCGPKHNLALTNDGCVYVWGDSKFGKLGVGLYNDVPMPRELDMLSGKCTGFIACGNGHSMAVLAPFVIGENPLSYLKWLYDFRQQRHVTDRVTRLDPPPEVNIARIAAGIDSDDDESVPGDARGGGGGGGGRHGAYSGLNEGHGGHTQGPGHRLDGQHRPMTHAEYHTRLATLTSTGDFTMRTIHSWMKDVFPHRQQIEPAIVEVVRSHMREMWELVYPGYDMPEMQYPVTDNPKPGQ
eukprot:GFYU01021229.1.p1 GENE.GFYU01021229.1~~GFYU01021229.1.p1  ORF type:complete len:563 (-),score=127.24 GFYU01021229.1:106-1794(-)